MNVKSRTASKLTTGLNLFVAPLLKKNTTGTTETHVGHLVIISKIA